MSTTGEPGLALRWRALLRGESLWLFVAAWAVLGSFVNTRDQFLWNLQHAWVEALAERGAMYVEGSPTPRFALDELGDYWTAPDGHRYARSAPLTYLTAAPVYWGLARLFGLSYRDRFDLTSTLVTFLTTGLASALAFLLLYRLARRVTGERLGGLAVAAAYSFGTLAFPYSGVLYQHQTAAVFFLGAFAIDFSRRRGARGSLAGAAAEGLLLGLGIGYSFAYAAIGLAIGAYCVSAPGARHRALVLAGLALGIAPLLWINAHYYGGPLTTVYQAAHDARVAGLSLSWARAAWRLRFYLTDPTTGVFFYCPVLLLSLPGLALLPRELRAERRAVAGGALLSFAHLLVAGGTGDSQFGPRLLIPTLPFLALGLLPWWTRRGVARLGRLALVLLALPSIVFCGLGAQGTTMFRDVARWNAWYVYLRNLFPPVPAGLPRYNLAQYVFPLRGVLLWVALGASLLAAWRLAALRREPVERAAG